jgi:glycerol-3-phosphate dehydrogenase
VDEPAVDLSWRAPALEELSSHPFDLLVIGGGIIGSGIANEATRAGLAVALVDRRDFGSQTSSASSKLIHGGLRYLRLGDIRLVREAHQERRALMRVVAPSPPLPARTIPPPDRAARAGALLDARP